VTWTSVKDALKTLTPPILWQTAHRLSRTRHPKIAAYQRDDFLAWVSFKIRECLGRAIWTC
jgi:hypothetical protein